MKYILLFLVALLGSSLLNRDVVAQTKSFDRVFIQLDNIPAKYSWSDNPAHGQPATSGSENVIISPSWLLDIDSCNYTGDTIILFFVDHSSLGTLKLHIDTVYSVVDYFKYSVNESPGYPPMYYQVFSFVKKEISRVDSTEIKIDMDSADLLREKFSYKSGSFTRNSGGASYSDDYHSLDSCISTSRVQVFFAEHQINNAVPQTSTERVSIAIFPNPASGNIMISSVDTDIAQTIDICNEVGQKIYHAERVFFSKPYQINTALFPSGVYRVKIGKTIQKFIIQH